MQSRTVVLAAVLCSFLPFKAYADTYDYNFSGVNTENCNLSGGSACNPQTIDFTFSSTSPLAGTGPGWFSLDTVNVVQNTTALQVGGPTLFQNTPSGTAIFFNETSPDNSSEGIFTDLTLFSGPENDPTFATGNTMNATAGDGNSFLLDSNTSFSATDLSAVPEPSSWVLLLSGLLCGLWALWQRRAAAQPDTLR